MDSCDGFGRTAFTVGANTLTLSHHCNRFIRHATVLWIWDFLKYDKCFWKVSPHNLPWGKNQHVRMFNSQPNGRYSNYKVTLINSSVIDSSRRRTYLAGLPRPLWRTETLEAVLHVDAGSALSTGAGGAFVRVWNIIKSKVTAQITTTYKTCSNLICRTVRNWFIGHFGR